MTDKPDWADEIVAGFFKRHKEEVVQKLANALRKAEVDGFEAGFNEGFAEGLKHADAIEQGAKPNDLAP